MDRDPCRAIYAALYGKRISSLCAESVVSSIVYVDITNVVDVEQIDYPPRIVLQLCMEAVGPGANAVIPMAAEMRARRLRPGRLVYG